MGTWTLDKVKIVGLGSLTSLVSAISSQTSTVSLRELHTVLDLKCSLGNGALLTDAAVYVKLASLVPTISAFLVIVVTDSANVETSAVAMATSLETLIGSAITTDRFSYQVIGRAVGSEMKLLYRPDSSHIDFLVQSRLESNYVIPQALQKYFSTQLSGSEEVDFAYLLLAYFMDADQAGAAPALNFEARGMVSLTYEFFEQRRNLLAGWV
jgi:hypothetical protein